MERDSKSSNEVKMKIIQVRLDNDRSEGMFHNYYNYEFGLLRDSEVTRVDFDSSRQYYMVSSMEYNLITRINE